MSESADEWLGRRDHPLINNVVLNIVFKHLRRKDLRKCRLVCKTWNALMIPFIRNAFLVTVYGNDSKKKHEIGNFVKVLRSNKLGIPFGRFKLGAFRTTSGVGNEFLQLCGGDAIKSVEFLNYEEFKVEDVSQILRLTPKLERFKIPRHLHSRSGNTVKLFPEPEDSKPRLMCLKQFIVDHDNPNERNTFCPTFLEEFITAAQNISSFHLYDSFFYPRFKKTNFCNTTLEVLSIIEKLGRESYIQELVVSCNYRDIAHFELFRKMTEKSNGLKLKQFEYSTCYSLQEDPPFQSISLFKDTLEYLQLRDWKGISFMECPKMPCLQRLSIGLAKNIDWRFVDLKNLFPVLTELELDGVSDTFFPQSKSCPAVKSFKLRLSALKISGFNQILTVFPNLTEFRMDIYRNQDFAEILGQIWSHMTQLVSLSITGSLQTERTLSMDSVLTGISTEALRVIRDDVDNLGHLTSKLERIETILKLRNQHLQLPSIGNLTHLRSLYLGVSESTGESGVAMVFPMTDLTGYLGFYPMQYLKHINVRCQFTKTCCEILTKDMGLESWKCGKFETTYY